MTETKVRTWIVNGWMGQQTTITTVGGTRREAKAEAQRLAAEQFRFPGRTTAALMEEIR